jgi:hypothetical protein
VTIEDDSPQCGREDYLQQGDLPYIARCCLPKGHWPELHVFIHTWSDRRDEIPK